MAKNFTRIEKGVNVLVGKPVSLLVYGLWLTAKLGLRGTACVVAWLSQYGPAKRLHKPVAGASRQR